MQKIDYIQVIQNLGYDAAKRIYPSLIFTNRMAENQEVRENTLSFVDHLLARWMEKSHLKYELIPDNELQKFAETLPIVNELHFIQRDIDEKVGFWVSYCVGIRVMSMETCDALPLVLHLCSSYDGRGFVYSYQPSKGIVEAMLQKTDLTPEHIIRPRIARTEKDANDYMQYIRHIDLDEQMKIVRKEYYYHDFNPLPDDCYLLSQFLLKEKMYSEWVTCLLKIEVLQLQVEFMSRISTADDFLAVLCELHTRGIDTIVQKVMLLNMWIKALIRDREQKIAPQRPKDDDFTKIWQYAVELQNRRAQNDTERLLPEFINIMGGDLVSDIVFEKNVREGENAHLTAEREMIGLLQQLVANMVEISTLSLKSDNINYLSFIARQYADKDISLEKSRELKDVILRLFENDGFKWNPSLENNNIKILRSIAALFVRTIDMDNDLKALLKRFKIRYEGINADKMSEWSPKVTRETLLFCALLLTAECDDLELEKREIIFKEVTKNLIIQCHCCGNDFMVEYNYLIALILAEVVADQILIKCYDDFEMEMWNALYEKNIALIVLKNGKQEHKQELKDKIRNYYNTDWQIKKKRMIHAKMNEQVENIESVFMALI